MHLRVTRALTRGFSDVRPRWPLRLSLVDSMDSSSSTIGSVQLALVRCEVDDEVDDNVLPFANCEVNRDTPVKIELSDGRPTTQEPRRPSSQALAKEDTGA
jgi:hypothetical protein